MTLGQHSLHPEPTGRVFALQIVIAQFVFSGSLGLLGWLFSNQQFKNQIAIAILCGGLICALANLWLVVVAFRPALGKPAGEILAAFYLGEAGKFLITASLFFIAFKRLELFKVPGNAFFMFAAFLTVQSTVWIYPLVRRKFVATLAKINRL